MFRRRVRLLAALLALGPVAMNASPAQALPASYLAEPTAGPAGSLAIIGDSLTIGYWAGLDDDLRAAGFGPFRMEARSARRTIVPLDGSTSGIDAVRHVRNDGFDARVWVVALGTNDVNLTAGRPGEPDRTIVAMLDEIGPGHVVVWVNVHAGRSSVNAAAFNARLAAIAAQRPGMWVADWASLAATRPEWMRDDGVHNTATGAVQRNRFVAAQARWAAATVRAPATAIRPNPARDPLVSWRTPLGTRLR